MKKLFLMLLVSSAAWAQTPSVPVTAFNNVKIQAPVQGTLHDSVMVWRGSGDKIVRYLPIGQIVAEAISGGTAPGLQAVTNAGNISTNPLIVYSNADRSVLYDKDNIEYTKRVSGIDKKMKLMFQTPTTNVTYFWPVKTTNDTIAMKSDIAGGGAFVPLSGTVTGSPVTGDINLEDGVSIKEVSGTGGINLGDSSLARIAIGGNNIVIGGDANTIGISGNDDYSANNDGTDRKIYPQTGWVKDLFVPYTGAGSNLDLGTQGISSTSVLGLRDYVDYSNQINILYDGSGDTASYNVYFPPVSNAIKTVAYREWVTAQGYGSGTVTGVSVVTANGVSGSVATSTTTPAITLTLGAITPTSVVASGSVTGSNLSGTNTGDSATNTTSNTYADGKVADNLTASTTVAPSKTAVNSALSGKVNNTGNETIAGIKTFSSPPVVPTQTAGDNSTKAASTAYVDTADALKGNLSGGNTWAGVQAFTSSPTVPNGTTGTQAVNRNQLDTKAALASPTFTGVPTAPTASPGTNSTQLATTAYVDALPSVSVNATTVVLSSATLNSTYPSVAVGHRVICASIIAGAMIYTKATEAGSSDIWLQSAVTVTP